MFKYFSLFILFSSISFNSLADGTINGPNLVCPNTSSTYFIDPVSNSISYKWTLPNGCNGFSSDNEITVAVGNNAGIFTLEVDISDGSTLTYSIFVNLYEDPIAAFSLDLSNYSNANLLVSFINESSNATFYEWTFYDNQTSTSNLTNPSYLLSDSSLKEYNVSLIAISENGCTDVMFQPIYITTDLIYYIPNAFTPDGDAFNEIFLPVFYSGFISEDYELLIGNRSEGVLFETKDMKEGWNGTYKSENVKDGTYVWVISYKDNFNESHTITGYVNLLR